MESSRTAWHAVLEVQIRRSDAKIAMSSPICTSGSKMRHKSLLKVLRTDDVLSATVAMDQRVSQTFASRHACFVTTQYRRFTSSKRRARCAAQSAREWGHSIHLWYPISVHHAASSLRPAWRLYQTYRGVTCASGLKWRLEPKQNRRATKRS